MNKLETKLQEKKKLLEEYKLISQHFPNSQNYKVMVERLGSEIADISERLYKEGSK